MSLLVIAAYKTHECDRNIRSDCDQLFSRGFESTIEIVIDLMLYDPHSKVDRHFPKHSLLTIASELT